MANIKNLTLLHSNDMHGDFLAEEIDKQLLGGVSMLSGYVNKSKRGRQLLVCDRRRHVSRLGHRQ